MSNLYLKLIAASICTVLGLALEANTEAKAATFSLKPTITFEVSDYLPPGADGLGDSFQLDGDIVLKGIYQPTGRGADISTFAEINIGSLAPNSIVSAILQTRLIFDVQANGFGIERYTNPGSLGIFGYVGNGTADASDFEAAVFLSSIDISFLTARNTLNFDVTSFVNQRVNNGDTFAGFSIRALNIGAVAITPPDDSGDLVKLIVEPVPEPTTIFGSAIGLWLGGWLKRKKSSQQNKAVPQR
jgi:hypothetical protein